MSRFPFIFFGNCWALGSDWASPVAQLVKNLSAGARDSRNSGLIPGSGRSPGEGNDNLSSTLAWEIPWTEEPGGLQSMGVLRVPHTQLSD